VVRSVVYNEVPEPDLLKWAKTKPHPRASTLSQVLHVRLQIEGERVFCAQALDGPADKQRAAVKSAMGWRFKSDRGDFNGNVIGTLIRLRENDHIFVEALSVEAETVHLRIFGYPTTPKASTGVAPTKCAKNE
jgi:hypothetical protein